MRRGVFLTELQLYRAQVCVRVCVFVLLACAPCNIHCTPLLCTLSAMSLYCLPYIFRCAVGLCFPLCAVAADGRRQRGSAREGTIATASEPPGAGACKTLQQPSRRQCLTPHVTRCVCPICAWLCFPGGDAAVPVCATEASAAAAPTAHEAAGVTPGDEAADSAGHVRSRWSTTPGHTASSRHSPLFFPIFPPILWSTLLLSISYPTRACLAWLLVVVQGGDEAGGAGMVPRGRRGVCMRESVCDTVAVRSSYVVVA
jgi:hypothetical protein